MSELGERLAELRQDKQERQKDVAELLHVTPGSVSNYETGTHLPTVEALRDLADHYDVTMDYLMGRTNSRISTEILNKQFVERVTYGMLLERLSELPMGKRVLLLELMEDMRISNYLKKRAND